VSALLRAELLKVRTIRTFLWLVAVTALLTVITALSVSASEGSIESPSDDRSVAQIAGIAVVFALVSGIVVMAGESTHGTITQTLLVTPVRERVLIAKGLVAVLIGLVLAAISEALVLAITVPGAGLDVHNARHALLGTVVAAPLAAALGAGFGAIVGSQGAAVGISLVWLLIGENAMPLISQEGAKYVPGRAFAALASGNRHGSEVIVGMGTGGIVAVVWTAAFFAAGIATLLGRDV
jgi:ABC-2 type transport system permease protein